MESNTCKSCNNIFTGDFCTECGQKVIGQRNTVKHLFTYLLNSFDIDRGVLFTAKSLFTAPGRVISEYLDGKTKVYYNPLKYLIVIASIYAVLMIWFNVFDTNLESMNEVLGTDENQTKLQKEINAIMKKYLSFVSIIVLPFYSLVSSWVFRKRRLFYAEHLIMNAYFLSQYLLILTGSVFVLLIFPSLARFLLPFGMIVFISYYTYAYRDYFRISFFKAFFSSILTSLGGLTLFYAFIALTSIVIIIILKLLGFDIQEMVR